MNWRKKWNYRVKVCTVREVIWPGKGTMMDRNYVILYSGCKIKKHEFGKGYYVSRYIVDNLYDFERVNGKICKIRFKLKY